MKKLILSIIVVLLCLVAGPVFAKTVYVSPDGSNTSPYDTWAKARTTLPTSGLVDGDLVYIDGGTSGKTYTGGWSPQSGTSAMITYRVGQDANHNGIVTINAAGAAAAINLNNKQWITVDGNYSGQRHLIATGASSAAILGADSSNVAVKYIYIEGCASFTQAADYEVASCYFHTMWATANYAFTAGGASIPVRDWGSNKIHHNYFEVIHTLNCVLNPVGGDGADGITNVAYCDIYNNEFISTPGSPYTANQHADGIQAAGPKLRIFNNTFANWGNYSIFTENATTLIQIYNNVLYLSETCMQNATTQQALALGDIGALNINHIVANNTFIGFVAGTPISAWNQLGMTWNNTDHVYNNLFYNCGPPRLSPSWDGYASSTNKQLSGSGAEFVDYAGHDYRLKSTATALINQGVSMAAYFTTDKDGGPRVAPWDIGAYEYGGTGLPASPTIHLSTATINSACTVGTNALAKTFQIGNTGGGQLSYVISDNQAWVFESPTTGDSTGEYDTITINYSTSSLSVGSYSATITITDAAATNSPQTITVNLTVSGAATPGQIGPISPGATGDDGAIWYNSGWQFNSAYTLLGWGKFATYREWAFVRFTLPSAIASGATVSAANLELYGSAAAACDDYYVYVTESADAPAVAAIATRPDIDGGSTVTYPTTAEAAGAIHVTSTYLVGAYNSIPVAGLIQYLIDTYGGLAAGAHIMVWLSGAAAEPDTAEDAASTYDTGSNPPRLTIQLTAGAGGGLKVYGISINKVWGITVNAVH